MRWTPEEWWAGQDAFIIGGGPSLRTFNWTLLFGRNTLGCNDAFQLGKDVCSACVFGDLRWFNVHRKELQLFPRPVFTNQPSLYLGAGVPWLRAMPRRDRGLFKDALGWGGNTGCAAINLALVLGAVRVFLLGFDMKMEGVKTNWHDVNIGKPTPETYVRFQRGFEAIASDLPKVFPDRKVFNCNPDSSLKVFPFMSVEEALCGTSSCCA